MKTLLFAMTGVVTITAVTRAVVMVWDPSGRLFNLPLDILMLTPFSDFTLPGILLLFFVGMPGIIAVFYHIKGDPRKYSMSVTLGIAASLWTFVQVVMTRTIHWQDIAMFGTGLLIVLLAFQVWGKWVV